MRVLDLVKEKSLFYVYDTVDCEALIWSCIEPLLAAEDAFFTPIYITDSSPIWVKPEERLFVIVLP
jgi:hypothetical protein